jgi:hypothetical protein
MKFKRYGGTFTGRDGGGNINVSIIGVYVLIASAIATLMTGEVAFVVIGFFALLGFTILSTFVKGGASFSIKVEQYEQHLREGERFHEEGDSENAAESFRRAAIYGEIPEEYRRYLS